MSEPCLTDLADAVDVLCDGADSSGESAEYPVDWTEVVWGFSLAALFYISYCLVAFMEGPY